MGALRDSVGSFPKNPTEDVPKNLVFHVHCCIKSIFAFIIWFDVSEVIWLLFKTQMKDDWIQYG